MVATVKSRQVPGLQIDGVTQLGRSGDDESDSRAWVGDPTSPRIPTCWRRGRFSCPSIEQLAHRFLDSKTSDCPPPGDHSNLWQLRALAAI